MCKPTTHIRHPLKLSPLALKRHTLITFARTICAKLEYKMNLILMNILNNKIS